MSKAQAQRCSRLIASFQVSNVRFRAGDVHSWTVATGCLRDGAEIEEVERCACLGIPKDPVVTMGQDREAARELVREALGMPDIASDAAATYHLRSVLALLDPEPCKGDKRAGNALPGDAIAHAIGVMAAISERAVREESARCVKAIALEMETCGLDIARHDMGAALLLDRWAAIIRDRGSVAEPGPRRDN